MKRALVVGSGISGLLAALMLKRDCDEVWLIERADGIGGLLRTWTSPEGIPFDYGTHIIRETGIQGIDQLLFDGIDERDWHFLPVLKSGNYFGGRLNQTSPFIDVSGFPRGVEELLRLPAGTATPSSAQEYLEGFFGPTLAREVFTPVLRKLYGCGPEALHPDAHRLFGLTRVVALDAQKTRELKKNPALDARLAFHSFLEGRSAHRHYYPRTGGIGRWIELLEKKLLGAGVRILTRSQLSGVKHHDRRVRSVMLAGGEEAACDLVVWTIPAAMFLHAAGVSAAGKPPQLRKTTLHHYVFDRPFLTDLHYFSCFDPGMEAFRVTLYPNIQAAAGSNRCTVEVLSGGEVDPSGLPAELERMGAVPAGAKVLYSHHDAVPAGFPVYTPAFVEQSAATAAAARAQFDNVMFLGKGQGGSFFMSDVLRETWEALRG